MTGLGQTIVLVSGALLTLWVLNLVRRGRLYVGYAIVLVAVTLAGMALSLLTSIGGTAVDLIDEAFPGTTHLAVPLFLLGSALVYVLTQVSILSSRVTRLVRELSLEEGQPRRSTNPSREKSTHLTG